MLTHALTGARKPEQNDGPLGGLQISNAVDDLSPATIPSFATQAARNTQYGAWVAAGGTMRKGLKSHTQADDRYWRYDGSAWQYAGGAPPPIVACTPAGGWQQGPRQLGVFKDSSGQVNLMGGVDPTNNYNPQAAPAHAFTLPVGYRPAQQLFRQGFIPIAALIVFGLRFDTDGKVYVFGANTNSITVGLTHYMDDISFHPTYAGTVPLS